MQIIKAAKPATFEVKPVGGVGDDRIPSKSGIVIVMVTVLYW